MKMDVKYPSEGHYIDLFAEPRVLSPEKLSAEFLRKANIENLLTLYADLQGGVFQ